MTGNGNSELRKRWDELWRRVGVASNPIPAIDPLLAAYAVPSRHYHNLHHIEQCLAELDGVAQFCESADAVELAIWFHDAVYDATRGDNEERSAELAATAMREAGVRNSLPEAVVSLILATKHDGKTSCTDSPVMIDIDLSILGQSPDLFDAYEQAIRQEYAHVEQEAFNHGRAGILRRFLDRPTIYSTDVLRQRYEMQARQNLERSIAKLEGIGSDV